MVLLLGNYPPDQQQSMQRFSAMMLEGLRARGINAELTVPNVIFGNISFLGPFAKKWLGYIDKYVVFPRTLRAKIRNAGAVIVHICDHSNAVYTRFCRPAPVLVTCHDLLAVRGGLGEDTDCPATFAGRILQKRILRGLGQADAIECISQATAADARRLLGTNGRPLIGCIPLGLNYPYRKLPDEMVESRLVSVSSVDLRRPFVMHVGSNLRRKNREGVLRIVAALKDRWNGQLVFVGERIDASLRSLADRLQMADRIVDVGEASNELLEALYNRAVALLYPSRFEGFGWPVIEAQACGCPVICSDSGPLPEVGGDAALLHPVEDEAGFAADVLRLSDPVERARWSDKSLAHVKKFSTSGMIDEYIAAYRRVGAVV